MRLFLSALAMVALFAIPAAADEKQTAAREAMEKGWTFHLRFNADDNVAAMESFRKAVEIDPDYARAHSALALSYFRAVFFQWFGPGLLNTGQVMELAAPNLEKASADTTALVHVSRSLKHLLVGEIAEAKAEASLAVSKDPDDAEASIAMAWVLFADGQPDKAAEFVEKAISHSQEPYPSLYLWTRGAGLFHEMKYDQLATEFQARLEETPHARELTPLLAAANAMLGNRKVAGEALSFWDPVESQNPVDDSIPRFFHNLIYESTRQRMSDGLYIAGLPDDITVASLDDMLRSDNPAKRFQALKTLQRFGPTAEPVVPTLIALLDDKIVQKQAILTLAAIGPAAGAALPALEAIAADPGVSQYAKSAIARVSGN